MTGFIMTWKAHDNGTVLVWEKILAALQERAGSGNSSPRSVTQPRNRLERQPPKAWPKAPSRGARPLKVWRQVSEGLATGTQPRTRLQRRPPNAWPKARSRGASISARSPKGRPAAQPISLSLQWPQAVKSERDSHPPYMPGGIYNRRICQARPTTAINGRRDSQLPHMPGRIYNCCTR